MNEQPQITIHTIETTTGAAGEAGATSVASGRLPNPFQTFTVGASTPPAQQSPEAIAANKTEHERADAWHGVSEQLIARMKQAILDEAGTWEHTFPEGNIGEVVGAPDAAVVAARTAFDMLYEHGLLHTDPEAMREAASRLLTAANEAEAAR